MSKTLITQHPHESYRSHFEVLEKHLNGDTGSAVHGIRSRAFERFMELGFPGPKHEEWRFTNIAPIAKSKFKPVGSLKAPVLSSADMAKYTFGGLHCTRLVFVNGRYAPDLSFLASLPEGTTVGSLAEALESNADVVRTHLAKYATYDNNTFTALNTAFMQDGAFVHVPDGKVVEDPIHLLFISSGSEEAFVVHPRNLIIAGNGSQVSLVETYVAKGAGVYFTNAVTEFVLGEQAVVEHDKFQDEAVTAFHIGTIHVQQKNRSNYTSNCISLGGSLVRNNITVVLDAEWSEATLNGLSLATGDQLIDNHTTIDHAKPNCQSHELYKSILADRSRGVFNGKIFVRKDAQKTDAKQTNKTLLLSDGATIDTKPQLEIFADDVKCTHGATVGQLDEEQLFYLRARGISEDQARDILTFAFASDVIQRVHVEPLRDQLDQMLQSRLRKARTKA